MSLFLKKCRPHGSASFETLFASGIAITACSANVCSNATLLSEKPPAFWARRVTAPIATRLAHRIRDPTLCLFFHNSHNRELLQTDAETEQFAVMRDLERKAEISVPLLRDGVAIGAIALGAKKLEVL